MVDFQIGDSVIAVSTAGVRITQGMTGTVVEVPDGWQLGVKWDNFAGRGHSGRIDDPSRSCWYVLKRSVEPIVLSLENE